MGYKPEVRACYSQYPLGRYRGGDIRRLFPPRGGNSQSEELRKQLINKELKEIGFVWFFSSFVERHAWVAGVFPS